MTEKRAKRGSGTWTKLPYGWQYRFSVDGHRRSVTRRTQGECRQAADKVIDDYRKQLPGTSTESLKTYLERWLKAQEARVRPRTVAAYRSAMTVHAIPALGPIRLCDLTHRDIERLTASIVAKGRTPRMANLVRTVLGTALRDAERDGLLERNPVSLARSQPKRPARIDPLTQEEAEHFLAATAGSSRHPLYVVALALGLRQGELLALRWQDVEHGRVHVTHTLRYEQTSKYGGGVFHLDPPKTAASGAYLPMPRVVADALEAQKEIMKAAGIHSGKSWQKSYDSWGLIFRTSNGRPINGKTLTKQFQADLGAANLPRKRFHDLRHTTATFLLAHGVDSRIVQAILRHTSQSTTAIYTHATETIMRDALDRPWEGRA